MTLSEMLLSEFDEEMANTRKMLECVPEGQFGWKPHQKSSTLGRLASHVAEMPLYAAVIVQGMAKKPSDPTSTAQLLELWDQRVTAAREAIAGAGDDHLNSHLGVKPGFAMSRAAFLRRHVMNHLIHHRGQLSVYLRLLNVAIPGMFGPSADERNDKSAAPEGEHRADPGSAGNGQASHN